jgi:hypothetical protein
MMISSFPIIALAIALYGAGNGIGSVARGTVPLALFGADRYPVLMGRLGFPLLMAMAVYPYLGGLAFQEGGADLTLSLVTAIRRAAPWPQISCGVRGETTESNSTRVSASGRRHRQLRSRRYRQVVNSPPNWKACIRTRSACRRCRRALMRTWSRDRRSYHSGGSLKLAHYDTLGRVKGSIAAAVERALQAADVDPAIPRDRARCGLIIPNRIPA